MGVLTCVKWLNPRAGWLQRRADGAQMACRGNPTVCKEAPTACTFHQIGATPQEDEVLSVGHKFFKEILINIFSSPHFC